MLLPLPGLCLGPHPSPDWCPLNLESFDQNGPFERGTNPCTLHPPLRKIPAHGRFGWILPQLPCGCSPQGAFSCFWAILTLEMPSSRALQPSRQKQRRMVLCPLSSCALTATLSEQGWAHLSAGLIVTIHPPVMENTLTLQTLPVCARRTCLCSIPEVCINTQWMCRHIVSWWVSVTAAGLESTCYS